MAGTEKSRVALITGASSGIGAAMVHAFAGAGYRIAAAGRSPARTNAVAAAAPGSFVWTGDLSKPEACQQLVDETARRFGAIDVVINSAGLIHRATAEETTFDQWRQTLALNAGATFFVCRATLPVMRAQGGGVILNIASDWGLVGGDRAVAYCASKGAVVLMTRAMARDHAHEKIRVNAICPGDVDTPMLADEARQRGLDVEVALREAAEQIPTRRLTRADEVAALALFLASDAAAQITGAAILVDGGNTA